MGNSVSALKRDIDDARALRADALDVTPPNEDGRRPRPRTPLGTVVAFNDNVYHELSDLYDDFRNAWTGQGQDDRHLLLEKVLTWMAKNSHRPIEHKLESIVIGLLYKDLPHPPAGYLSLPDEHVVNRSLQKVPYAFRSADGSDYNVLWPSLGKAGLPYARTVSSTHPLPASSLPDPSLVFDMLLKRDKFEPHPAGVSSLFFAFADLVIHSIFNTDHNNPTINKASSYLDLSPLYGSSDKEFDTVRRKDGTGRLFEDVFADSRLLFMPPSACALLVLFSRNHNYTADKIYAINESGTYRPPRELTAEARLAQDEEIFQRARLVNCGFFMQVILGDYVGAILGLVRDGHSWRLKILDSYRDTDHAVAPRGEGNVVSIEFNLMYRWHAAISAQDTAWVENEFRELFPGKDLAKLTLDDLKKSYRSKMNSADPKAWAFGGLKRDAEGRFSDDDLAKIIQDATEWDAGAFKARGVPEAMKFVELLAIEQARKLGVCSLNEFRRFMGLKPYANFSEWNPDESVANAARMLYHDIENLELYVGMQAEEAKEPGPGAGLCPGYTLSRAIISDAVCLSRGDRFMTTELTPQNLTSWGYADVQFDTDDGSYGGLLTKLLFRTLPGHYGARSAYAHFPFLVPARFQGTMAARDGALVKKYTWDRPTPAEVRTDRDFPRSEEGYMARIGEIAGHDGYAVDTLERLVLGDAALATHRQSFARFADAQIRKESLGGEVKYVDVVRDVINMVPVYWIAALIKPRVQERDLEHHHHRGYHPEKYFEAFADLADYVYINTAPEDEFSLRARTAKFAQSIIEHIDAGSAMVHATRSDLITRIAFRALETLPKITLPGGGAASPTSPASPDFFMDSDAPCE
ncbi:hypothetical protein PHLGIDRAFT_91744, partial [Phlebiopsis gigantea 11061_1 CR5-6]